MDNYRKVYAFAFKTFGDFGITIAVPAVLAALGGKWLDARFGTKPMYTVILLIIAFALTIYIIKKKVTEYGRAYEELTSTTPNPSLKRRGDD